MLDHLQILQDRIANKECLPLCRVPSSYETGSDVPSKWRTITYRAFGEDVENAARFHANHLQKSGLHPRDNVGVWTSGDKYDDLVRIIALSRAGFVPTLISSDLDSPSLVYSMLDKAGSKALIHEPELPAASSNWPLPTFRAIPLEKILEEKHDHNEIGLPAIQSTPDDIQFVLHTSGSSGSGPKLIHWSARWIDSAFLKSVDFSSGHDSQDVWPRGGKFCHISGIVQYFSMIYNYGCMVLHPWTNISVAQLKYLVDSVGVNCLFQMVPRLRVLFNSARGDPSFLRLLQELRVIITSGSPLHEEEAIWCIENRIPIVMQYGMTECGLLLHSDKGRDPNILKPIPAVLHHFVLLDQGAALGVDEEHSSEKLYEFVVLPESPEVPHQALWKNKEHFGTDDVFEQVSPRAYVYRGRKEEWIVNEIGGICDTKIIEDQVRKFCSDLVHDCIVVGNDRPCPALIVESTAPGYERADETKGEILRRLKEFNDCRHDYERVTHPDLILVVEKNELPRTATKGNIRRKATEEQYSRKLDDMYRKASLSS